MANLSQMFLGGSSAWESKLWIDAAELAANAPDRLTLSYCAAEPFTDSGDVTPTNAAITGGYCANNHAGSGSYLTLTSGMVTSSTAYQAGWGPEKLLDNVDSTVTSFTASSAELILDYGATAWIYQFGIRGGTLGTHHADSWALYGSNDSSNWTAICSGSGTLSNSTITTTSASTIAPYRYYKVTLNCSANLGYCQAGDIYLYYANPNAATVTLNSATISGKTAGKIIFRAQNMDASAALDVGNSGSNKIEVYPMLSGSQGSALTFTSESLGSNVYRYTSGNISLASATGFGVKFQSYARTTAPNFRIYDCLWAWR